MEIISHIPQDLINFLLVVLFSLLIGLEQRKHHIDEKIESLHGTDRTLTLIGIWGFILYIISPVSFLPFITGEIILSVLLGIYYFNKIRIQKQFGLTSIIITLITYNLTPLVYLEPPWMALLIVVSILIIVEMKENLFNFSKKFDRDEFTTLAKFIIIAGIILPLLPNQNISQQINISPYQIWLAIVAVSGISYFSYLLKKFIFPNSGTILTAILGGMYSSTATTIILAKKSREENDAAKISSGIIAATGMMYIRILILAWFFNKEIAINLLPYFLIFIIFSSGIAILFYIKDNPQVHHKYNVNHNQNPLEFKTAIIFGLLFMFFALLTNAVVSIYGKEGVNILSIVVGITDIDPYILNLFQSGLNNLTVTTIVSATIIATASNNLIKMIYSLIFGDIIIRKNIILGFSILIIVSILSTIFILF
ncbi:MAG TPA: DUF4010 domain-containing protein [Ignavibacteria bacterium]|nr:DUF4010 domain-containing protein [Ignavibacteria bacterium]